MSMKLNLQTVEKLKQVVVKYTYKNGHGQDFVTLEQTVTCKDGSKNEIAMFSYDMNFFDEMAAKLGLEIKRYDALN